MDEQVIDLGIKFMRGYEPAPTPDPVPGGGTDVTGSLAQTGDLNIALIVGLVLMTLAIVGIVTYAFAKNKQFASVAAGIFTKNKQLASIASFVTVKKQHFAVVLRNVAKSFKSLNFANFSLRAKIISAVVAILTIVCIICGCFSMNAHAAEGSITVTPNTISAVVSEEGQISSWDPTNVTLANTSTTDKFDFKSIKVALTEDAKSVDALKTTTIKITGFDGKTVFDGKASDSIVTCVGLSLDKSSSTTLAFEIAGTFDIAQLESLYGKQLFKISLNTEKSLPMYDNLYEYTLDELQQVSAYLATNYDEEATYDEGDIRTKFRDFRDNGLTAEGTDNGVDMNDSSHPNKQNHWAMDEQGRIASDKNFEAGCNKTKTIQARIIGICEDWADAAQTQKIGLTFMTTHALATPCAYQTNPNTATYGWAGSTEGGQCTLQTFLNPNIAADSPFPQDLVATVKTVAKGYQYSNNVSTGQPLGNSTATNKFWAPSMKELYGDDITHAPEWWPKENEGVQYALFANKGIKSGSGYSFFNNIDKVQDNSLDRTDFVWSRSLYRGRANGACGVRGDDGGAPYNDGVSYGHGVVSCFCI